jgi:hypothetical protein
MTPQEIAFLATRLQSLGERLAHPDEHGWSSRPTEAKEVKDLAAELRQKALTEAAT